jgi:hypothetical protein
MALRLRIVSVKAVFGVGRSARRNGFSNREKSGVFEALIGLLSSSVAATPGKLEKGVPRRLSMLDIGA